ncbi:hypothetical protein [Enterococcus plantarum]|uniref:hypothetical protein n=1 Tax=Enterococcus plantarum TaxID=1077675 RepID=UPI001A8F4443|nr:hypothetical protein [Enterococcus plantarum]MBO0423076.1 hypothetical protein [Enterococcus plantarum]
MLLDSHEISIQQLKKILNEKEQFILLQGNVNSGKSKLVTCLLDSCDDSSIEYLTFHKNEINDDDYSPFIKASRQSTGPFTQEIKQLFNGNMEKDYSAIQVIIQFISSIYSVKNNKNSTPFFKCEEEAFLSSINNKMYYKIAKEMLRELNQKKGLKKFLKKKNFRDSLTKVMEKRTYIFFFEEINTWDENSLILVKKLIDYGEETYPLINQSKIIFTLSNNIELSTTKKQLIQTIIKKCSAKKIDMTPLSKKDLETLIFEYSTLSMEQVTEHEVIEVLQQTSADNLEELPYMIQEIEEIITDKSISFEGESALYNALRDKLNTSSLSSEKSEEMLEYASLLGNTFSRREISMVSNLTSDEFQSIVNKVIDLRILRERPHNSYMFATTFFQELFKTRAFIKRNEYHEKLEKIVAQLYPHNYLRRANYLFQVKDKEKETERLYFLGALSDLRNNLEIHSEIKENLTLENLNLLEQFEKVYDYLNKNDYSSTIRVLEIIDKKTGEMTQKIEIALLLALAYSKRIVNEDRLKAVNILEKYIINQELEVNFPDVYERLSMRLMIIYVHAGRLTNAQEIGERLLTFFSNYPNDNIDILIKKNTLFRISNAIHKEEVALEMTKQAKEFFLENQNYTGGLIHTFNALTNYASSQLINGLYEDSFTTSNQIKKFIAIHPNVVFPRQHIWKNNYYLSGYLSKQLHASECREKLKGLVKELPINAERLFIVSNLSIFNALMDDFNAAIKLLNDENKIQVITKDMEGKYNFRVQYNLAVYSYLNGSSENGVERIEKHINILEQSNDIEKVYELRRAKLILKKMKNKESTYSGFQWLHVLTKETAEHTLTRTCEDYKKLGFMFTSLSNWDI